MKRLLLVLILSVSFLPGCAFVRGSVGEELESDRVAKVLKGTSTRAEVGALFGAPDDIVAAGGYEIFHYRKYDSKMGYFLFLSRINVGSDNLYVFFNKDGIVEEVVFGQRADELEFQIWPFGD